MVSNYGDENDLQIFWCPMRTNFGRNWEKWQVYDHGNFIFEIRKKVFRVIYVRSFYKQFNK